MISSFAHARLGARKSETLTFTANGKRWFVRLVNQPFTYKGGKSVCLGLTDHSESRILVVNNAAAGETLVHEILHAVWPHEANLKKLGEEGIIRVLEGPLFEALATLRPVEPGEFDEGQVGG